MSEKRIIQTPSLFKVDDSFQDERFMKVRIAAMHSGKNLNQSKFSTNVIKAAKDTFANIPILANIVITTDEDGNQHMDYGSHDMHVENDFFDDNNQRIIYDEKVVGVVPEHNNFEIIRDEETGNDYVWVDALIYRDYGNYCADILESRGGTTSVSAEISCEEISYDSKDKALQVDKMTMCAITLLGEDVQPGMAKAHATVFSIDDDNREKQIFDIIQELKFSLDKYIASLEGNNTSGKEDNSLKKKFSETPEAEVQGTPSAKFEGDGDPDFYDDGGSDLGNGDGDNDGTQDPVVEETPLGDNPINNGGDDPVPTGDNPSVEDDGDDNGEEGDDGDDEGGDPEPTPEDIAAAQAVTDEIDALPETITLDDADDVAAARAAYDALTDLQKTLVSDATLKELTDAEKTIADLTSADAVIDMIDALPDECGLADVAAVTEAKDAYEALTDDQKALVPEESVEKLNKAEEGAYGALGSTDDKPKKKTNSVEYSVKCGDINKSHFATLTEKLSALSDLVNITYGDVDGTWYSVDADEDAKIVYMHDWWCDKHFRQSYAVKKDVYTLKGDRVETFAKYLSQDEINQLEQLKSNYSYIEAKLQSYESEPEKLEVLNKDCYKKIANTKEFEELSKRETYFEMSVEDVQKKADEILLSYAKKTNFALDESTGKTVGRKMFANPSKPISKRSRYGGLGKNK